MFQVDLVYFFTLLCKWLLRCLFAACLDALLMGNFWFVCFGLILYIALLHWVVKQNCST